MNTKSILSVVGLVIIMAIAFISLVSWMEDTYRFERINFCGQTMCEANESSSWHNGVYFPEGCDLSKYKITR